MPKEIICDVGGLYDLVLEWKPEHTWLQLGLRTTDGHPVADKLDPAELGRFTGLFATLSREQTQQLIAAARQARDDVFGADT